MQWKEAPTAASTIDCDRETASFHLIQQASQIELNAPIPQHIAIIMDGNRRWAKKHDLLPVMGHYYGAEVLQEIVESAATIGIKAVTFYTFSTENWKRTPEEVEALLRLFTEVLRQKRARMVDKGVRLCTIGNVLGLPLHLQEAIRDSKQATAHCNEIDLILALNYGGRDDIRRATIALLNDCAAGKIDRNEITEQTFTNYLDTAMWQDPELLIRTSGEMRLSNFMLWQLSYSEIYITDVLWPDFTFDHLKQAVAEYQKRQRRHGR